MCTQAGVDVPLTFTYTHIPTPSLSVVPVTSSYSPKGQGLPETVIGSPYPGTSLTLTPAKSPPIVNELD
jgi:hypothetical protein